MDKLKMVIESIQNDESCKVASPEFIHQLAGQIYDKDAELTIQLYNKVKALGMRISPLLYNYFIWHSI
jgi:hypothetical protein